SVGTPGVAENTVTPGYFKALHIHLVRGTAVEDRSRRDGLTSVVVNQVLADRLWPNRDPVGETLIVTGKPHKVIGVAAYKDLPEGDAPVPFLFRIDSSAAVASGRMLVSVKGDSALALSLLRGQILAVDSSVAIAEALPLTRLVENYHADVPLAMRVA